MLSRILKTTHFMINCLTSFRLICPNANHYRRLICHKPNLFNIPTFYFSFICFFFFSFFFCKKLTDVHQYIEFALVLCKKCFLVPGCGIVKQIHVDKLHDDSETIFSSQRYRFAE